MHLDLIEVFDVLLTIKVLIYMLIFCCEKNHSSM